MKPSPLPVRPWDRTDTAVTVDLTALEGAEAVEATQPATLDKVLAWLQALES